MDTFKIRNTFGYCNCSRATDINPMAAQCTSQTAKQNGVKVSCVVTDLVSFSAVVRKKNMVHEHFNSFFVVLLVGIESDFTCQNNSYLMINEFLLSLQVL